MENKKEKSAADNLKEIVDLTGKIFVWLDQEKKWVYKSKENNKEG